MSKKKVAIGSDHAGYSLKQKIIVLFSDLDFIDCGTHNVESVDYPDFAKLVNEKVASNEVDFGILICGSGIGMSIAANRNPKIRAALCHNEELAKLAREHNDANVLVLGARFLNEELIFTMIRIFVNTEFAQGRHSIRVEKLNKI